MKWNRLTCVFLVLVACSIRLPAQQSDAVSKLLEEIRSKAQKGDPAAQCGLGSCYYYGDGVIKDFAEAVKWYRRAAEQGNVHAQVNLASCYDRGEGVTKDVMEATKWLRKAAEQNDANAQETLGCRYDVGRGVPKNEAEAIKWHRKAAEQGLATAQFNLGISCSLGEGVLKDSAEAVKWYRKAAEQGLAPAQFNLGFCYYNGDGMSKDLAEAVKWYRKAAEQNNAEAQYNLAACYSNGDGVPKDYVEAYKWMNLASAQGSEFAKQYLPITELKMTPEQIAEAQHLAREFKPRKAPASDSSVSRNDVANSSPFASGTGFFITEGGFLITNEHVVHDATQIRLITTTGFFIAKVVKVDAANDLALLKAEGKFAPLPIASSRTMHLGNTVVMVGFPNIGLQGFAPKFARGEIAALSGAQDDARYFQISVPVQPGNSGGALVDEHGNVVGVVSAKLNAAAALAASGALPENVNYAVKSSFLLSFLESVPEVATKLKEPETKDRKSDEVVKSAEQAAVLILVY